MDTRSAHSSHNAPPELLGVAIVLLTACFAVLFISVCVVRTCVVVSIMRVCPPTNCRRSSSSPFSFCIRHSERWSRSRSRRSNNAGADNEHGTSHVPDRRALILSSPACAFLLVSFVLLLAFEFARETFTSSIFENHRTSVYTYRSRVAARMQWPAARRVRVSRGDCLFAVALRWADAAEAASVGASCDDKAGAETLMLANGDARLSTFGARSAVGASSS